MELLETSAVDPWGVGICRIGNVCRWLEWSFCVLLPLFKVADRGFVGIVCEPSCKVLFGCWLGSWLPCACDVNTLSSKSSCLPLNWFWVVAGWRHFPVRGFSSIFLSAVWQVEATHELPLVGAASWATEIISGWLFCWDSSTVNSSALIPSRSSPGSLTDGSVIFTLTGRPKSRLVLLRRTDKFMLAARLLLPTEEGGVDKCNQVWFTVIK